MISQLLFGNLWHGKLGAGTIEIESGSPVSSVTFDGTNYPVKTISGNLGCTRYLKAPGLPSVETPAELTAVKGKFHNDIVLYSDSYRYSPIADTAPYASEFNWLLWDGTAQRWRKMSAGFAMMPLSTSNVSFSPAGTPMAQISVDRFPPYGTINHVQGDTPPSVPSSNFVGTKTMPLLYDYFVLKRPWRYPYKTENRTFTIDASPDGRRILARLEAQMWDGWQGTDNDGLGSSFWVFDSSTRWIFNVWEYTFSEDGSTISDPVPVYPNRPVVPDVVPWADLKLTITGPVYWESRLIPGTSNKDVSWYLPVLFTVSGNVAPGHFDVSMVVNAAYDKDGVVQMTHVRVYDQNTAVSTGIADMIIGRNQIPADASEAAYTPAWTAPSEEIFHIEPYDGYANYEAIYYPGKQFRHASTGSTYTPTYVHKIEVAKGNTILKSWTGKFSGPIKWRWVTNNVAELSVGTTSLIRIGPGVIDDTPIEAGKYASWNPRTGELVSSTSPVGFV